MRSVFILAAFIVVLVRVPAFGQAADSAEARLISSPKVTVPQEAKESSLGGIVTVLVSLDEAGNALGIRNITGPGAVCDSVNRADVVAIREIAKDLALRSTFAPAKRDGQPISSTIWVTFTFPGEKGMSDFDTEIETGKKEKFKIVGTAPANPADELRGHPTETVPGGVLNGKASILPRPTYSPAARAVRASGSVKVQVLIDEQGEVFLAKAVEGHPLLKASSVRAACGSRFGPTFLSGHPVKVSGFITYNFIP
ncbi:MAG: energy transducer TonB [Pyrinomonadaceae bacterium]